MSSYQEMIQKIADAICENALKEKNYILVGDNSSGKSEVLQKVIERKLGSAVYFIDSVNRTFDAGKVELRSRSYLHVNLEPRCVITERMAPDRFNLQDSFSAIGCIEKMYAKYMERLAFMCKNLLGREIRIVRETLEAGLVENKVLIDGVEASLSSGYQAVIRIFCEILYFCDVMEGQKWEKGFVVIDELDEYLSPKYSAKILSYLQHQFPELSFLVTTHSIDLVESSEDANLIVLKDLSFEIYLSREIGTAILVDDIFTNLFFENRKVHQSEDDEIDKRLRRLLNLKIAGVWDKNAEDELWSINTEEILPHQKMICRQIKEW
ncbi:hypothetical protein AALA00_08660 [Lachnospiraceae bacterium 46-15]